MDEFFDRIFIINLPHRADRREEMEKQLANAQIKKGEFFEAFKFADPGAFYRVGSRGNYMSQLTVLKKCIGAKNMCMLEDDVNFSRKFVSRCTILSSLPNDWAIFYGGYGFKPSKKTVFLDNLNLANPLQEFTGSHFFAVNGHVIDKFVASLESFLTRERDDRDGGPMPMDGALNIFRRQNPNLSAYVAYPPLGYQRSSRSDCDNDKKWFDQNLLVSPAIDRLRKVRNALRRH